MDQLQRTEELQNAYAELIRSCEWMSSNRANTIFIEEPEHVHNFFARMDAALKRVREAQG